MPNQEVIRAQTTPEDGALFATGLKNSKSLPRNHVAFTEDLRQKGVIEISSNVRTGSQLSIPFEKTCTLLEDVEIEVELPPLVPAGGATYIRYVDFVMLALLKSIKWSYVANNIAQYNQVHTFCDIKKLCDEKRYNEYQLVGGNMSAAARNTFAVAPYKLRMRIPTPWNDKRYQAPVISALSSKLTLTIDLANASEIVQTDGTKPASLTMNSVNVVFQQIHFTGAARQELTALTNTPNGLSYLIDDINTVDFDVPANFFRSSGNEFAAVLNELDGPIHEMNIIIRTQDQLDPTNANVAPYEIDPVYLDGLEYRITSNNMDIQDPESQNLDQLRKIQKFYQCLRRDTDQVILLWSEFPEMDNTASGSVSFGNFTQPRLFLKNPKLAGNHPALRVTVNYRRFNWNVLQRGTLQKVWR